MKTIRIIAFLTLFVIMSASALALRGSIGNGRIYIDEVLKQGEIKMLIIITAVKVIKVKIIIVSMMGSFCFLINFL